MRGKKMKDLTPQSGEVKGGGSPLDPMINTAGGGADKDHKKLKSLQPRAGQVLGGKGAVRHQANIKFGDLT